jgi:uncharacterized repeat protein (TIGR04076 family)
LQSTASQLKFLLASFSFYFFTPQIYNFISNDKKLEIRELTSYMQGIIMMEHKKPAKKEKSALEITVHDIKGVCPVYKKGDKILIKDPEIILDQTNALCTHALPTILHYSTLLQHHWCPLQLGLTTEEDNKHAYIQCVDPGEPYTHGGTVIFRCEKK